MRNDPREDGRGTSWVHDPVLAFYPGSHAWRAAPRDCAVSVRTRERRYLLRGGRDARNPTRTVRAARVRCRDSRGLTLLDLLAVLHLQPRAVDDRVALAIASLLATIVVPTPALSPGR